MSQVAPPGTPRHAAALASSAHQHRPHDAYDLCSSRAIIVENQRLERPGFRVAKEVGACLHRAAAFVLAEAVDSAAAGAGGWRRSCVAAGARSPA